MSFKDRFLKRKIHPLTAILALLLLIIQYPLWFGKGSWWTVFQLTRQVNETVATNKKLEAENALLVAEVKSLKEDTRSIEERARTELSMIRKDEVFVQLLDRNTSRYAPVEKPLATQEQQAGQQAQQAQTAQGTPEKR